MKLGLDIGYKSMSMAIEKDNKILDFIDKPISNIKRDCNRAIMDKILMSIHSVGKSNIKSIGLSLPSKIDAKKGIMFDINNIPYWKGMGLKKILEDEFNTKVWIDNDVNCFALGEKYYGMCKGLKDIACILLGPNVGTSIIVNNKIFYENRNTFSNAKCLSFPSYDCVRIYRSSFVRTMEDLNFLIRSYKDEMADDSDHEIWNELGSLVGRLISILLCNYDPQVIVLGGDLAKSYVLFSEAMDKYLEKFIHPQVLLNMIIFASIADHQQALGAISMSKRLILV
ncbi:ROK family protein [Dysgonomonas sp. Marseille-P4677]|uniref:ROK family protein n=1 Tax=Dysgonomonas sp. Marseille-P4677 TaxID=2364790 RepID=UPI001913FC4C|nr:ROK family protein [Dysgonomonas sp. Marseille-P4677]MBK5722262.1 ROK family protein [Dysgonomonas sp. Marseille-P4677]